MPATNWHYNEKIPKITGVLRVNCCETCCNIPQEHLWKSLLRRILSQDRFFVTSVATSNN